MIVSVDTVKAFLDARKGTSYTAHDLMNAMADDYDAYDRAEYLKPLRSILRWKREALVDYHTVTDTKAKYYGKEFNVRMWHAKRERSVCSHCNGKGFIYRD